MLDLKNLLGDDYTDEMSEDDAMELFNKRFVDKKQYDTDLSKYKAVNDKLSTEAADYKKKLRERQTLEEQNQEQLKEAEEARQKELETLRRENTITKFKTKYLGLGYSDEMAEQAANAQFDGDADALFLTQQKFNDEREKNLKSEWLKQNPVPPAGNKDNDEKDPFIEGFFGR